MTERADLAQRTRHAFRWIASTTILWQLISWAMTFWTVRVLHPSDYGLMAFAETVFPYAMLIASLDVGAWLIHKTTLDDDDRRAATSIALTLGALVAATLLLTAPVFARFYGQPGLVGILRVLSIAVVARSLTVVPEALLRRGLRFRELGVVSIVVGLARGITQVSLAHQGWGVWSLVTGLVVKEALEKSNYKTRTISCIQNYR